MNEERKQKGAKVVMILLLMHMCIFLEHALSLQNTEHLNDSFT